MSDKPIRQRKDIFPKHRRVGAAADDGTCSPLLCSDLIKDLKRYRLIRCNPVAFFDLNRKQSAVFLNNQIDFVFNLLRFPGCRGSYTILPAIIGKAEAVILSSVCVGFHDFIDDKCLEKRSAHCTVGQCIRSQPAGQPGRQAGIAEIYLWRFNGTL